MSDLLDLHHIATDADYAAALDELEQLADPDECDESADSPRAHELTALIAEYEARVASVLADAMRSRGLR